MIKVEGPLHVVCKCDKCKTESQELVAWMDADVNVSDNNDQKCFPIPLYAHLPQRTWVGLTDEQIWQIATDSTIGNDLHADKFARAIEAKLKDKNGYAKEEFI